MLETATDRTLRAFADQAHRQRSLAAWHLIKAIGSLPGRLLARHAEGAAPKSDPSQSLACAA